MPNWTILLVPPLLAAACLLARGLFDRHPGHHLAAAPAPRMTTRRRRALIEEAQTLAWLSRVERHHEVSPLAAAQIQAHVTSRLLERVQPIPPPSGWEPATGPIHPTAWQAIPAQHGPVPAALDGADSDPEHPYLDRPWADDTGTFTKIIEGEQ